MTLHELAEAAGVPPGMRPYLIDTARALILHPDYDPSLGGNVIPILIRLTYCCDIYAPPDEMAERLLGYFLSRLKYHDVASLRIPEFHCTGPIWNKDVHATFLSETAAAFILDHPDMVRQIS